MDKQRIEEQLPKREQRLLAEALPFLRQGRPEDEDHIYALLHEILSFPPGQHELHLEVLLPAAILHDIGHAAILPEHFHYLTGADRLQNGKLVHMLAGAKIAQQLLEKVDYHKEAVQEIVTLISIHDGDQVEGMGNDVFDTPTKRLFHDFDRLVSLDIDRLQMMISRTPEKKGKLLKMLEKIRTGLFFDDLQAMADERWERIKPLLLG